MKGICKLCGLEKELLKKSHIIPEFMYQYLFDSNHRYETSSSSELLKENQKPRTKASGEYEAAILCKECDNDVIGKYESYASKAIFAKSLTPEIAPRVTNYHNKEGQSWSICENVDYKKFKLFLLSILWRASISKRKIFDEIDLGPHENSIKEMIFNDDPKEVGDYPFEIFTVVHDKSIPKDFVMQPRRFKIENHKVYVFPISGLVIMFYVSNSSKPRRVLDQTIKRSNSITLMHVPQQKWWPFMAKYLNVKLK